MERRQQTPDRQPPVPQRRLASGQTDAVTAALRAIPPRLFPLLVDCLQEEYSTESLAHVVENLESKRRGGLSLPDDLVCCVFSFFARTPREWRALRLVMCVVVCVVM